MSHCFEMHAKSNHYKYTINEVYMLPQKGLLDQKLHIIIIKTTLKFEIFWRANWHVGNRQVWSEKRHNCAESSDITRCMWIQLCIGHSGVYRGHYRDVKGRLFASYESYNYNSC